MKLYTWGLISTYEECLDVLYSNNPSCDREELKAILDKAMTEGGEDQRDLLLSDAIEIIFD
jgi:hypothetical protein